MSRQGKYNLGAMLLLPAAAMLAAGIAGLNGVWAPYFATYLFLFALNLGIMLPAALISALFLRRAHTEPARWIAILPTLVPSLWGAAWYLWRALVPAPVAPGAEYLGAMQYLLVALAATTLLVLLLRLSRLVPAGPR